MPTPLRKTEQKLLGQMAETGNGARGDWLCPTGIWHSPRPEPRWLASATALAL